MIKKYGNAMAVFAIAAMFCAPLSNDRERPADLPHPGMKKIQSAGKSFHQGWNDTLASLDEKPGVMSSFSYDYWLDTTEVTQRQYYDMTGKVPVFDSTQYGKGERYPMCFVTWFDVILFCNVRSKCDGLDTVYKYSGKYTQLNGSIGELTDLRYDLSKDGYRLPTEAEWEFAAREESSSLPFITFTDLPYAQNVAWFGANSYGVSQPVATKKPNSIGLYDLAGNVSEWTNDWKGAYSGKAITNSIGVFPLNSKYEKIIKGGSFDDGLMYLRPSYRSSPFVATPSTAKAQIGFRCARGAIPNARYMDTLVSNPFDFKLDSFGLYNDPPDNSGGGAQEGFANKMHLFWKLHRELELVFLGTSQIYCGVDCSVFGRYKALNMGFAGCELYNASMIMRNYLFVHAPELKCIGINIPFYSFKARWMDSTFSYSLLQTKGCRYDQNHNFWKDIFPSEFDEIIAQQPFPPFGDSLGLIHFPCGGWGGQNPDTIGGPASVSWTVDDPGYEQNLLFLLRMIQDASVHGIHLLAINFPESPYYKYTGYYLRAGPSWETGREIMAQLKALEAVYPYFHVYDAYQDGNHDYNDGDAYNWNNLCPNGAKKLTSRLDTFIDSILNK